MPIQWINTVAYWLYGANKDIRNNKSEIGEQFKQSNDEAICKIQSANL